MESELTAELGQLIDTAAVELSRQPAALTAQRPRPGSWSKREILGHLIDSAANNHHRFVRAQQVGELEFPSYDQEAWVACQHYGERDWHELVALWVAYNRHLVHVLRVMPRDELDTPCKVDRQESPTPIPLRAVAEEYLVHMRHHLEQLIAPDGV